VLNADSSCFGPGIENAEGWSENVTMVPIPTSIVNSGRSALYYQNPNWRFRVGFGESTPDLRRALGTFSVGAHEPFAIKTSSNGQTTIQAQLEFWDNYDWIDHTDPNAEGLHPFGMLVSDFREIEKYGYGKPYTMFSSATFTLVINDPAGNCGTPSCSRTYTSKVECTNPPGKSDYISVSLSSSGFTPYHTSENTDNILYYP
jgi:hypothetical protein